jgi:subtilase family serine protease
MPPQHASATWSVKAKPSAASSAAGVNPSRTLMLPSAHLGSLNRPPLCLCQWTAGRISQNATPMARKRRLCSILKWQGAVAPGAKIVVYFAPNTDAGFLDAINRVVMDKRNKPSVISISWGGPESTLTSQLLNLTTWLSTQRRRWGKVCVACSDNGSSSDGASDGKARVDFPASSPNAMAYGGTHLLGTGSSITDEEVWNDLPDNGATGTRVSDAFPLPSWQKAANVPTLVNPGNRRGRGLPDLAGDADPLTGYRAEVDGSNAVVGRTSAVAPLLAGLVALFSQALAGSVGYLNPNIYKEVAVSPGTFHDITRGNDSAYQAQPGWAGCTGCWGGPGWSSHLKHFDAADTVQNPTAQYSCVDFRSITLPRPKRLSRLVLPLPDRLGQVSFRK